MYRCGQAMPVHMCGYSEPFCVAMLFLISVWQAVPPYLCGQAVSMCLCGQAVPVLYCIVYLCSKAMHL
jgi:hypothetical protein